MSYIGTANALTSYVSFPMRDNDNDICGTGFDCIGIGESVTKDWDGTTIASTEVTQANWQALLGLATTMFDTLCGANVGSPIISRRTRWTDGVNDADVLVPRDLKWRVVMQDKVNGKTFTHDFPCALPPGADWKAGDALSTTNLATINAFLKGPSVQVDGAAHNLAIIVSPYGNPMQAVSGYVTGYRYRKN